MDVGFRRGTGADARAAADLWLRARKAALDAIPAPVHSDDEVRAWFASHVAGETELWIAEDPTGGLAGLRLWTFASNTAAQRFWRGEEAVPVRGVRSS